jgi:murein DD-endopeptidase MepM/ murein hydrolase activator NlpD
MRTKRPALLALVGLLVVTLAAPAGATSVSVARRRQAEARARRAQLAARIDALRASDRSLENAVRTLDHNIVSQQAAADASRQAAAAADTAFANARARLAATQSDLAHRRAVVVGRAVAAYVDPDRGQLSAILASADVTEAARKESLIEHILNNDRSVVDQLRAAEEDLVIQRAQLGVAQQRAALRRRVAVARLVALKAARADDARVRSALNGRIQDYLAEADAMAKTESSLQSFIRSHTGVAVGGVSAAGLMWPVNGPVTSPFGMRWGRMHQGIDIGVGYGTPIHAAKAGEVIFAGQMSGYGNVIVISHGGGFSTLYAHQSRLGASDGQSVSQGEVIGYVGSTGHSTGPHLHFECRVDGTPENPMRFLP